MLWQALHPVFLLAPPHVALPAFHAWGAHVHLPRADVRHGMLLGGLHGRLWQLSHRHGPQVQNQGTWVPASHATNAHCRACGSLWAGSWALLCACLLPCHMPALFLGHEAVPCNSYACDSLCLPTTAILMKFLSLQPKGRHIVPVGVIGCVHFVTLWARTGAMSSWVGMLWWATGHKMCTSPH